MEFMSWHWEMAGDEPTVDNIEIYLSPMWHYCCRREFIDFLYFAERASSFKHGGTIGEAYVTSSRNLILRFSEDRS